MEYSFSNSFHQQHHSSVPQNEVNLHPVKQYFKVSQQTNCPVDKNIKTQRIKNERNHSQILTKDIKLMLSKYLKDIREKYLREFQSIFEQLSEQIERYSLSYDLASLIEAKYSKSDPINLIPMIRFQFSSLLPEISESISTFTSSLRNSITLNLAGKGTFKYQKKILDIPISSRIDPMPFSPKVEKIESRPSSYGSSSKHNRLGFGQIQTSHFQPLNTPRKSYGLQKDQKQRSVSREGQTQYRSIYGDPKYISPRVDNQIEDTLAKLNVDKQTRCKIQSVVNQHKNYNLKTNKENQYQDYQFTSPTYSEYLIHDPRGYTYEFTKTTTQ